MATLLTGYKEYSMFLRIEEIKRLVHGRELMVLKELLPFSLPAKEGLGGPCPICNDGDDRFHWDYNKGDWLYHCRICDQGGDILKLVSRYFEIDHKQAIEKIMSTLGRPMDNKITPKHFKGKREPKTINKCVQGLAKKILADAVTQLNHPYLVNKGLPDVQCWKTRNIVRQPEGITVIQGALIVPIYIGGELSTLEFISEDGNKISLRGGKRKGGYYIVSKIKDDGATIVITEGYATALSIRKVYPGPIIVAFSTTNLKAVRDYLTVKYPKRNCLFAADDDATDSQVGIGEETASKAKQANDLLLIPPFSDQERHELINNKRCYTDWNDFDCLGHDLDEAFQQVLVLAQKSHEQQMLSDDADDFQQEHLQEVMPIDYTIYQEKLMYNPPSDNHDFAPRRIGVCSPLYVIGRINAEDSGQYGLLLMFENHKHVVQHYVMPMSLLADTGAELRRDLLDRGLPFIGTGMEERRHLLKYLSLMSLNEDLKVIRLIKQSGWIDEHYARDDRIYGPRPRDFHKQNLTQRVEISTRSDLSSWKRQVANYAVGNPTLMFALSTAFAGPLLKLLNIPGMGIHFMGGSSCGKTTLLNCAASVWGSSSLVHNWRTTANALENLAICHNDGCTIMDEISQAEPQDVSDIVYMLANGQGKHRATKTGGSQSIKRWRTVLLSSGETSLEQHLHKANLKTQAGQEVRLIGIVADTGQYGAFEHLHGFSSGAELSDHLNEQCGKQYGTAMTCFLEKLTENYEERRHEIKQVYEDVAELFHREVLSRQVGRVAKYFQLIATAAIMASRFGIAPWTETQITHMLRLMFTRYKHTRGHSGDQEEMKLLEQVQSMLSTNLFSHFIELDAYSKSPSSFNNKPFWGYRKTGSNHDIVVSIPCSNWRTIWAGLDHRKVAKLCQQQGWMIPTNKSGVWQHNGRFDGVQFKHYRLCMNAVIDDQIIAVEEKEPLDKKVPLNLVAFPAQVSCGGGIAL